MHELDFRIEWLAAPSVRTPILAATWARLEIVAGGKLVTQAITTEEPRSFRSGIYTSLFPLASFLVRNWWNLFHERKTQIRGFGILIADLDRSIEWDQRHNLLQSREGMSYPNLSIYREDREVLLRWSDNKQAASSPIRFIGTDFARVDVRVAEIAFGNVVDQVLERLEGVEDEEADDLREDWLAIGRSANTERDLCERLAALGVNP